MPVVGCPKCKKKFKLSSEMLGKTVRCSNCETAFKTAGQAKPPASPKAKSDQAEKKSGQRRSKKSAAATGGPTQASKKSLKDVGLSGPINPQMDLFAQPIPSKRGPDPLGNFSLEDPGFGSVDLDVDDDDGDEDDAISEDKKHLFVNHALKSAVPASRSKKAKRLSAKPASFKSIRVLGQAISVFAVIGILGNLAILILTAIRVIEATTSWQGFENAKYFLTIAIMIMTIASTITYLMSLVFWPLAHANTSTLGAKGQKYSPAWAVGCWFIPLMNLFWVPQLFTELVKASKRPDGKKWIKLKEVVWEAPTWPIAIVLAPVLFSIVYAAKKMTGTTGVCVRVAAIVIAFVMIGLSLACIVSLVRKITKTQYSHFES